MLWNEGGPMKLKTHYAAEELANLPGMPTTGRRVRSRAQSEQWCSRPIKKKDGTDSKFSEYSFDSLPAETRTYLRLQHEPLHDLTPSVKPGLTAFKPAETPAPSTADSESLWSYYERKPERAKKEAQRKLSAILAIEQLVGEGVPKCDAYKTVAAQVGEHWQTVSGWLKKVKGIERADWLPTLVDQHAGRQTKAQCSVEAWDAFKADYLRRAQPTPAACYDRLKRSAKLNGWTIPALKTLMRRIEKEIPREAVILAREGKEGLKKCYPDQERDHSVFAAMEAINGDGYTFWPWVDFGYDVVERPHAWVWQDIFSSKVIAYRVDVSENTEVIRLSAGDLVERYGIPSDWWLDNTRAAANKTMTGGVPIGTLTTRFKRGPPSPGGTMAQYKTGTVTVQQGSPAVVGYPCLLT
jgi:putative transposase